MQVLTGLKKPPTFKLTPKAAPGMDAAAAAAQLQLTGQDVGGVAQPAPADRIGRFTLSERLDDGNVQTQTQRSSRSTSLSRSNQGGAAGAVSAAGAAGPTDGKADLSAIIDDSEAVSRLTHATDAADGAPAERRRSPGCFGMRGSKAAHLDCGAGPPRRKPDRTKVHAAISRVTSKRKACMPQDGTLDVWVLLAVTAMNLFAAGWGVGKLVARGALYKWDRELQNVIWIGVIFAFQEVRCPVIWPAT